MANLLGECPNFPSVALDNFEYLHFIKISIKMVCIVRLVIYWLATKYVLQLKPLNVIMYIYLHIII